VRDVEDTGGVGRQLLLYGRVFECGGHERWSFRGRIHEVMKKGGGVPGGGGVLTPRCGGEDHLKELRLTALGR
jgi:hypothetical protein